MDYVDRLKVLSHSMKLVNLSRYAQAVDAVIEDVEANRPLLDAKPTGIPGAWEDSKGGIIKTSKEPQGSTPPHTDTVLPGTANATPIDRLQVSSPQQTVNVLPGTPNLDPTQSQQLSTPNNTIGA